MKEEINEAIEETREAIADNLKSIQALAGNCPDYLRHRKEAMLQVAAGRLTDRAIELARLTAKLEVLKELNNNKEKK